MLKAHKISETPGVRTRWRVTMPSGKTYVVSTYPDSARVSIESGTTGRTIPQGVATALTPALREAIAAATKAEA